MKNHSKKTGNQQLQHAPGPIYPYSIRRQGAGPPARNRTSSQPFRVLTLLIFNLALLILFFACPGPPEETICGQGMVLLDDTCACIPNSHPSDDGESCECDTLYHWNSDFTECVMDTTTYNIIWEFDTLGIYPSQINDVSIISQNDIWAVGMITFPDPDSSWDGDGSEMFNAAHWDGTEWAFHHLLAVDAWGNINGFGEIYSVFSFDNNNIWMFSSRGSYIHYDGQEWTTEYVPERRGRITDIWGSSPDNLYFVGTNGSITHYNGNSFILIESRIDIQLTGIDGSSNGEYVMATGQLSGNSVALQIEGNEAFIIYDSSSTDYSAVGAFKDVGVYKSKAYFAAFTGLFTYDFITSDSTYFDLDELFNTYLSIMRIKVNQANDIFIAGDSGRLLHQNGVRWILDLSVQNAYASTPNTRSLDYKNNLIAFVGNAFGGSSAFIARGYR